MLQTSSSLRSAVDRLGRALIAAAASCWRVLHFAALALVMLCSPSTYDPQTRTAAAGQICLTAWQVLPWFTALSALVSLVLIRIVVVTALSYGLSQFALEMVVRVLVIELIPLSAALFVALRSGTAINSEVALMHIRGDFDALRRDGIDPMRRELLPRVVGSAFSVVTLATVSGALALVLAYLVVYGFSPWGVGGYTRTVGQIFSPAVTLGFAVKTALFSLAVAVIPITAGLEVGRGMRFAPTAVLRGMVQLFLALVLIEAASLTFKYI